MNIKSIIESGKAIGSKTLLIGKKYLPDILVIGGGAGVVFSAILACKETLNLNDILAEHNEIREKIEAATEVEEYTEKDKKSDICKLYLKTGGEIAKNYAVPATIMTTSLAMIFAGFGTIKGRYAGAVAAYNGLKCAFDAYRDRTREEVGEEKEKDIYLGRKDEEVELKYTDENGKEVTKKETQKVFSEDPNGYSIYARFFDETSNCWEKDPTTNLAFLRHQQSYFNDKLHARGYVFLNEVYDALGLEMTSAGAVVGWILGAGDDYVDFGIYDGYRQTCRDFVNGRERSILLDFNVDGVIYDKI